MSTHQTHREVMWKNVHSSSVCIRKTWEQHRHPSIGKWLTELWCVHTLECYCSEGTKQDNLKGYPENPMEWKKIITQLLHSIWFHLYDIHEISKLKNWRKNYWLPGVNDWGCGGRASAVPMKDQEEQSSWWWNCSMPWLY